MACGCSHDHDYHHTPMVSICDPCNTNTGCPIQLDWDCSIYHKDNNEVTALTCLGLTNGATLNQFAEAVDTYICQLNVLNYDLPCLRDDYTVNSLKQFAEAVDTVLCQVQSDIVGLEGSVTTPITPVDTNSIDLATSGVNMHTITANVKVSANAGNRLTIQADGLYSSPNVLSVNYSTKELSLVGSNTVSLAALFTPVSGFLGNVTADPSSPIDGQYWFRTDLAAASGLKIRLNGATRTITTS
jgi:hypothetical protein